MLRVVIDDLLGWLRRPGLAAPVGVAVEPRKVRRGQIEANAVTGGEPVGCSPHVDFQAIDAARLEQLSHAIRIAIPRA